MTVPQPARRRSIIFAGVLTMVLPVMTALPASPAEADVVAAATTVSVSPNGSYTIDTAGPNYRFAGSTGVPVSNITQATGSDTAGAYHEVTFDYTAGGVGRSSGIRAYDSSPLVLFSTTYRQAATNANPFPALSSKPSLPYSQTFADGCFAPY